MSESAYTMVYDVGLYLTFHSSQVSFHSGYGVTFAQILNLLLALEKPEFYVVGINPYGAGDYYRDLPRFDVYYSFARRHR